jgi:hypothetical protein
MRKLSLGRGHLHVRERAKYRCIHKYTLNPTSQLHFMLPCAYDHLRNVDSLHGVLYCFSLLCVKYEGGKAETFVCWIRCVTVKA